MREDNLCESTGVTGSSSTEAILTSSSPPQQQQSVQFSSASSNIVGMASPTGSAADEGSVGIATVESTGSGIVSPTPTPAPITKCPICNESFVQPKVLACFHTFCKPCLEKLVDSPAKIICPTCQAETQLCPEMGVDSLLCDYALSNIQDTASMESNNNTLWCQGCKSKDSNAVAHCYDCGNFLCGNCVMAHQFMHCFEGHRVVDIAELDSKTLERPVKCLQHKHEALKFFCFTCNVPICQNCTTSDHPRSHHQFDPITEVGHQQVEYLQTLLEDARVKQRGLVHNFKSLDTNNQRLLVAFQKCQQDINDTATLLAAIVEEQRQTALRDLENAFAGKQMSLSLLDKKVQQTMEKLSQTIEFTGRLLKHACAAEVLVFKKLLETRLQAILTFNPDLNFQQDLEFVTNQPAARLAISNTFGYVRQSSDLPVVPKPLPIARPNLSTPVGLSAASLVSSLGGNQLSDARELLNSIVNGMGSGISPSLVTDAAKAYGAVAQGFDTIPGLTTDNFAANYERWSNASSDIYQGINDGGYYGGGGPSPDQQIVDLTAKLMSSGPGFPPKSQIKRQKMIYHCKFGEFGVMEGQFTEPSGVAVTLQGDVVVADTNNHRIQVFDKEGRFKFQFGECGKRDGQLLYPNRVAVNRMTGDIVVTERSPTHQIQVYNQYGQFLRKFGANILQHPRGVTVDSKGRIVIVECKVMRVLIFDMFGNVLQKFGCSKYLEFPNGVVTSDKQEIYISDNRAHAVKVFNYEGQFVRQIGGEGITNYPIGVGINHLGEIVVADNHNNFNLTIFTQDGTLLNALESKVKHAQCFDVALMDDGSVVLASKDYRLYVYRYVQIPQMAI